MLGVLWLNHSFTERALTKTASIFIGLLAAGQGFLHTLLQSKETDHSANRILAVTMAALSVATLMTSYYWRRIAETHSQQSHGFWGGMEFHIAKLASELPAAVAFSPLTEQSACSFNGGICFLYFVLISGWFHHMLCFTRVWNRQYNEIGLEYWVLVQVW